MPGLGGARALQGARDYNDFEIPRSHAAGLPDAPRIAARRLAGLAEGARRALPPCLTSTRNIAIRIANLRRRLRPNLFVLHGDAVGGGERLRSAIETHVHRLVPPSPTSEVRIVFTDPEDWATLRAAAGLVLSQLLQLQL